LKKCIFIVTILVVMIAGISVAQEEQQEDGESPYFVHTVYLNQVFRHRLGFKVTYTAENLDFKQLYIPSSWFTEAGGKGEIIRIASKSVPYMQVYFREGEFSHVRLFVHSNPSHISWGRLGKEPSLEEKFNVETLDL